MNSQPSIERLTLILGLVLLAMACLVQTRKIDCSRFVFAPRCRGVAAKRAEQILADTEDNHSSDQDDSLYDQIRKLQRLRLELLARKLQKDADYTPNDTTGDELWDSYLKPRHLVH
ncbi:elevenin-Vc1-like [Gigantopelta aegis]|uniref:elevenin-Vc1-like n=1 Tax=Gigantopelta aegis TaxID=1735272 RepID=UPI001B88DB10|nr:elevenin-Vc1-like [Gigantopelta aegis]